MGMGKNCLAATNPFAWPVIAGILGAVVIKNLYYTLKDFYNVTDKLLWDD